MQWRVISSPEMYTIGGETIGRELARRDIVIELALRRDIVLMTLMSIVGRTTPNLPRGRDGEARA